MVKVSIILPTFNRSNLLKSAIKSALNQTYKNFELIICDDKSTDETKDVVKDFDDKRIKYLLNDGNSGPSSTRNKAILNSIGEYIAFLDDDDEWYNEKLELQVEILKRNNPKICGVHTAINCVNLIDGRSYLEDPGNGILKGNLLYELGVYNPIKTSTLVVKRKCLNEVGLFDEKLKFMEDRDLLIRLSYKWDFEYIYRPLINYNSHTQHQLTKNIEEQIIGKEILFERHEDLFKRDKKRYSRYILGLGVQCCQADKIKKGRRYILKSLKYTPFNKIAYFHYFSSIFGYKYYGIIRKIYKRNEFYEEN